MREAIRHIRLTKINANPGLRKGTVFTGIGYDQTRHYPLVLFHMDGPDIRQKGASETVLTTGRLIHPGLSPAESTVIPVSADIKPFDCAVPAAGDMYVIGFCWRGKYQLNRPCKDSEDIDDINIKTNVRYHMAESVEGCMRFWLNAFAHSADTAIEQTMMKLILAGEIMRQSLRISNPNRPYQAYSMDRLHLSLAQQMDSPDALTNHIQKGKALCNLLRTFAQPAIEQRDKEILERDIQS